VILVPVGALPGLGQILAMPILNVMCPNKHRPFSTGIEIAEDKKESVAKSENVFAVSLLQNRARLDAGRGIFWRRQDRDVSLNRRRVRREVADIEHRREQPSGPFSVALPAVPRALRLPCPFLPEIGSSISCCLSNVSLYLVLQTLEHAENGVRHRLFLIARLRCSPRACLERLFRGVGMLQRLGLNFGSVSV
jgi:hypothetical protein